MNPLPPSILGLGTITMMISITFFMQASAIAFNSRMVKEYRGVRTMFFSALAMSAGYLFLIFHPTFGPTVGITSNIAIYTGNMLLYISICQFMERPLHKWMAFGLIPFGYLALFITFTNRLPLIVVTELANIPVSLISAFLLLKSTGYGFRLGAILTALPLIGYALTSLTRIVASFVVPEQFIPGNQNQTTAVFILIVYVLSYLWTAGFVLMISQRLQSDLNDLAMNDMLTRVRNRRAMNGLLDFEIKRAERDIKYFSIILLDVDHFKRVNDQYGHDVGDEVLKWMAQNLQASARLQDTVSRWGGEEFLILLPGTMLADAVQTAERIRATIESKPFAKGDIAINITFSAGVACSQEFHSVDQLCKAADQALYIAKRTRNTVVSQDQIKLETSS